ncbi:hypothetical protein THAOC_29628 [Thalassiosira oceanica]|uniref:Uncharacterized protein n=1 Tax=Thalassiosira oceanica TaxID=159749 RepID=K0RWZ9_THAOC|nr:hypothetical protein THAOC_29628 [Thalassiosira oceanica]|eukprot:EJK51222.1 hypothetical protein THAOC_29628 [Thalassiosira oceanica]
MRTTTLDRARLVNHRKPKDDQELETFLVGEESRSGIEVSVENALGEMNFAPNRPTSAVECCEGHRTEIKDTITIAADTMSNVVEIESGKTRLCILSDLSSALQKTNILQRVHPGWRKSGLRHANGVRTFGRNTMHILNGQSCQARINNSLCRFIMRIEGLIVDEVDITRVEPNARATEHHAAVSRLRTEARLRLLLHGVFAPDCDSLTSTRLLETAKFQVAAIAVSGEECDGFCRSACQTVQFEDISPGPEIGDDDSIRRMNRIAEYSLSAKIADDRFPTSTPRYITKTWSFLSLAANMLETSTRLNNQNRSPLHQATSERTLILYLSPSRQSVLEATKWSSYSCRTGELYTYQLNGTNPDTVTLGREMDISNLQFGWCEWVCYRDDEPYPLPRDYLGRCLGPAKTEGNEMGQWILKKNGQVVCDAVLLTRWPYLTRVKPGSAVCNETIGSSDFVLETGFANARSMMLESAQP